MTVLEMENKYLNAIMQELKAHAKMYNDAIQRDDGEMESSIADIAIRTLLDLCKVLDIPVELKRGCVQVIGVYDALTQEPIYLYESIKMYEWEERV